MPSFGKLKRNLNLLAGLYASVSDLTKLDLPQELPEDQSPLGYFSQAASLLNEVDKTVNFMNEELEDLKDKLELVEEKVVLWDLEADGEEGEVYRVQKEKVQVILERRRKRVKRHLTSKYSDKVEGT